MKLIATRDALFVHAEVPGEAPVEAHVWVEAPKDGELAGGRCLRVLSISRQSLLVTFSALVKILYLFRGWQVEEEVRDDECLRRGVEEGRVAVGETVKEAVVRLSVCAYSLFGAHLTNVGPTHKCVGMRQKAVKYRRRG